MGKKSIGYPVTVEFGDRGNMRAHCVVSDEAPAPLPKQALTPAKYAEVHKLLSNGPRRKPAPTKASQHPHRQPRRDRQTANP